MTNVAGSVALTPNRSVRRKRLRITTHDPDRQADQRGPEMLNNDQPKHIAPRCNHGHANTDGGPAVQGQAARGAGTGRASCG
jgi:hypothetical protein